MNFFLVVSIYAATAQLIEVYQLQKMFDNESACVQFLHSSDGVEAIRKLRAKLDEQFGERQYNANIECVNSLDREEDKKD